MWDWTEDQIRLLFIRHGETVSNSEHRYLGKTDEGLSENGISLLRQAVAAGHYQPVDYLFTSPMKRCIRTADILYPKKQPVIIPEWEEMDFGIFEGKNYRELCDNKQYQDWIDSHATLPFPGGESREAFIKRCKEGFYRMLRCLSAGLSHTEEPVGKRQITVGAVVHGGTIMALLSSLYGGEYFDYQLPNGGGYTCRLKYDAGKVRVDHPEKL